VALFKRRQGTVGYFTGLLKAAKERGVVPGKTEEARKWFRDTAMGFSQIQETELFKGSKMTNRVSVGSMYMFSYDPKHKLTLPFYDMFPVVFPFSKTKDGFLGVNLHYLHPVHRARLMDLLYEFASNKNIDEKTRLRLSWSVLSQASTDKYMGPTVKRYLSNHYRSRFIFVSPMEWELCAFLPTERFQKLNKTAVWANSTKIINSPR